MHSNVKIQVTSDFVISENLLILSLTYASYYLNKIIIIKTKLCIYTQFISRN